jgi:Sec-independent protein secretion pathway component TatC
MTFYYKYYLEIKNRFFLLSTTWGFIAIMCYSYKEALLFMLINSTQNLLLASSYFIFTDVSEIFYVYMQLTFFISNQITVLMFFYHLLIFLALGLYKFEFNKLKLTFKIFMITWLSSIILLYKFLIPFSWSFFLNFQKNKIGLQPVSFFFEAKIIEYFNYFTNLYYICLLSCLFLIVITLLLNNISNKKNKMFRKLFYLLFVIFSTLITPPDVLSQIVVTINLIVVYETIIFFKYLKFNTATN